jgi:hypothetical protein
MGVSHPSQVRSALVNVITGALDAGSGPGQLVLLSATNTEVARLTFSTPAFAPASDGIAVAHHIASRCNRRQYCQGWFDDELAAARAYDRASRAQWGRAAFQNFPR